MKPICGKKLQDYWLMIKLPVVASFALILLNQYNIWALDRSNPTLDLLINLAGFFLPIYVGWNCVKSFECDLKQSAVAGGIFGLAGVLFGAAAALVMMLLGYNIFNRAIAAARTAGSPLTYDAVLLIAIFSFIGAIILTPIFTALIALLGAFAAQKMNK
ncbi:MAG: hypothetical protein QW568_02965 [Candidatus Anstonellaceae archaeon]